MPDGEVVLSEESVGLPCGEAESLDNLIYKQKPVT